MSVDRLVLFDLFDTVIEVSSAFFCSNPDALGFDESEKGIFYSLKNIARLHLDSSKEGDWLDNSAAGAVGELPIGEAGKQTPATGTGECLGCDRLVSSSGFSLMFLYFQTSRAGTGLAVLCLLQTLI